MDKIDTIVTVIIFIISTAVFFLLNLEYDESFYGNSITFLSITIGFTITSLSVLYNTECIANFAKMQDSEKKDFTVLHRLGTYYRVQIYFSILLILFYLLENLLINKFSFLRVLSVLNFPLLFCNCFLTYILIRFFIKLFTHPKFGKEPKCKV